MKTGGTYRQLPSGVLVPGGYQAAPGRLSIPRDLTAALDALERSGIPRRAAIAAEIRAALAPDSITVTDQASGVEHATKIVNSKHYPAVMIAGPDGHLIDSKEDWFVWFPPATNAANRSVGDLFNADATVVVRVRGVWVVPTVTAITGVNLEFILNKTSAVGTGGTAVTPRPLDSSFAALDADITARAGATGGATLNFEWFRQYHFNEETNAGLMLMQHQNLIPSSIGDRVAEIVLRQNQGLQVKQGGAGTVGLTGALMYFTVE